MKKSVCFVLVIILMLSSAIASAGGVIPNLRGEPTASPSSGIFTFRSGIQWNMSREAVRALETTELTERTQDGWSILFPSVRVTVSRFTADLVYMFYNDQLKMISYDFGSGRTDSDYQYLTGALDAVYGDHSEPSAADIIGIMDQIYPGYYTAEKLTSRRAWTAEGTLIYQYYYAGSACAILYVNAGGTAGAYDTTGL